MDYQGRITEYEYQAGIMFAEMEHFKEQKKIELEKKMQERHQQELDGLIQYRSRMENGLECLTECLKKDKEFKRIDVSQSIGTVKGLHDVKSLIQEVYVAEIYGLRRVVDRQRREMKAQAAARNENIQMEVKNATEEKLKLITTQLEQAGEGIQRKNQLLQMKWKDTTFKYKTVREENERLACKLSCTEEDLRDRDLALFSLGQKLNDLSDQLETLSTTNEKLGVLIKHQNLNLAQALISNKDLKHANATTKQTVLHTLKDRDQTLEQVQALKKQLEENQAQSNIALKTQYESGFQSGKASNMEEIVQLKKAFCQERKVLFRRITLLEEKQHKFSNNMNPALDHNKSTKLEKIIYPLKLSLQDNQM